MLTPTHSFLALAILARKDRPKQNLSVLAGSLVPDAFIYVAWVIYMLLGKSQSEIWDVLYFQDPVQFYDAVFNSFPIYIALLIGGWFLAKSAGKTQALIGQCITVFSLAALIHLATDMPVHASDAHRHFWPLSDWRFYSPLSYWETDHHSGIVTLFEAVLGVTLCYVLWRRFRAFWVRIVLGLFATLYAILFLGTLLFIAGIMGASA